MTHEHTLNGLLKSVLLAAVICRTAPGEPKGKPNLDRTQEECDLASGGCAKMRGIRGRVNTITYYWLQGKPGNLHKFS